MGLCRLPREVRTALEDHGHGPRTQDCWGLCVAALPPLSHVTPPHNRETGKEIHCRALALGIKAGLGSGKCSCGHTLGLPSGAPLFHQPPGVGPQTWLEPGWRGQAQGSAGFVSEALLWAQVRQEMP